MFRLHLVSSFTLAWSLAGATVADDFVIEPIPADAPAVFDEYFGKYVDVMGVGVFATANSQDEKVLHCARTLAQFIDNDEDGQPDNPAVHARMVADRAAMVMWRTFNQAENSAASSTLCRSAVIPRNSRASVGSMTDRLFRPV